MDRAKPVPTKHPLKTRTDSEGGDFEKDWLPKGHFFPYEQRGEFGSDVDWFWSGTSIAHFEGMTFLKIIGVASAIVITVCVLPLRVLAEDGLSNVQSQSIQTPSKNKNHAVHVEAIQTRDLESMSQTSESLNPSNTSNIAIGVKIPFSIPKNHSNPSDSTEE